MTTVDGSNLDGNGTGNGNRNGGARAELRILSGLHRGAAVFPEQLALMVGSDPGCDIVLLDDGVWAEHLMIETGNDDAADDSNPLAAGRWRVLLPVVGAAVIDAQGRPVASGTWLAPGDLLRVANVWLSVTQADARWVDPPLLPGSSGTPLRQTPDPDAPRFPNAAPGAPRAPRAPAAWASWMVWAVWKPWAIAAGTAVIGGVLLVELIHVMPVVALTSMFASAPVAAEAAPTAAPVQATVPEPHAVVAEVRRLLKERGLPSSIRVNATPGAVQVEAELDESQRPRFESALVALDKRLGGTVEIHAQMRRAPIDLPFTVREVLMGPVSSIILSDGRALRVGETMDGVKLAAVRPGKLLFTGRRTVEVAW
jgi:type III secretion protein D